jgi:hypothetical protein
MCENNRGNIETSQVIKKVNVSGKSSIGLKYQIGLQLWKT